MKQKIFTLLCCIALLLSNQVFAHQPGDIITLDLSKPLNPTEFTLDPEKGHWTETYDDENYPYIEFETFGFTHIISGLGMGSYWDGFTFCTNGDTENYGEKSDSGGWIKNQWGCMAGGGIKTDENGNIVKNEQGEVEVEKGIPYLVSYWGYFMEMGGEHGLQTIITENGPFEAVGVYVCNHPWPYYGNINGDGFARALDQEGDYFKLIIHGLDENYEETGKSVEHYLAKYENGKLTQSDKWEWVDLSSLGEVGGFYYTMETTDADPQWGPNTAVYFCMDKLQVRVPESNEVDVTIVMNSTSRNFELINKETGNGVDAGTADASYTYTFQAEPGDYILTAYQSDNTTSNGSIELTITEEGEQKFQFLTITTGATNSGWVLDSDYTVSFSVSSREGKPRLNTLGTSTTANRATFLVYSGDSYNIQLVPNDAHKAEGYLSFNGSGTATANVSKTGEIPMGYPYSVTVPEEATVYIGQKDGSTHFKRFREIIAESESASEGKKIYNFRLANKQQYNYRIKQPGKLTRTGIFTMTTTLEGLEITPDMLEGSPKEVDYNVSSNKGYNVADIFLNINEQGYLKLGQGDTFQIVNIRAWQVVNSITGNYFIEPDYHYTVINENGEQDNNVVTVDSEGKIEAKASGTAIVLVTYDAFNMTSADGGPFFGAIWPENTGVFVVSVGQGNSDINPNMLINETLNTEANKTKKVAGYYVDAELDVFYYAEKQGSYQYTFTPENVTNVTLAQPVVGENMTTYSGFSTDGVSINEDGSYTVDLIHGRNIVKLSSESGTEYQVLTAKAVDYTVTNVTNPDEKIMPGDQVSIQFSTLYHPNHKLAGVYNMSAGMQYTVNNTTMAGGRSQYTFASNAACQTISATVPEDWDINDDFTFTNGVLKSSSFGDPFGKHRHITLDTGRNPNFTAVSCVGYFGALPDIAIRLKDEPTKPESLKGTADETTAELSWTHSIDNVEIAGYNIYIDGEFEKSTTDNYCWLTGLSPLQTYSVEVEAFDGEGFKSEKASVTLTTIDKTAPTVPADVVTTPAETSITITWTASTDNVAVAGYNIYLNEVFNQTVSSTSATISSLKAATTYTIEVESFDTVDNKSEKASTEATTTDETAPGIPENLIATPAETSIEITWTASTDNVGVIGYNVYLDGVFKNETAETTFTLSDLTPDTSYEIEVEAVDAAGNKSGKAKTTIRTDKTTDTDIYQTVITAYPNPFTDFIILNSNVELNVIIFDISGRKILEANLKAGENKINTLTFPEGSYIVKYGTQTFKMIK